MITLRDLEFLSALARRKHFSRAADDCGVSQPAFSMRIRKIEEKLNAAIVKRGNRFQGFTPEGDALVGHARKILNDLKVMEQEFRSKRGEVTGVLSLGVVPTAVSFAARRVKELQTKHPGITVRMKSSTSLDIQQGLENGHYEAGFTYGEGISRDVFRIDELYDETYLLLAPKQMAPRMSGTATWAEAAQLPLSLLEPGMQNRRILDRVFGELGLILNVKSESSDFTAAMVLASEGVSATIVPEILIESMGVLEGTVALPLVEPELNKVVCLVTPLRDPELPTVDALRRVCAEAR